MERILYSDILCCSFIQSLHFWMDVLALTHFFSLMVMPFNMIGQLKWVDVDGDISVDAVSPSQLTNAVACVGW